MADLFNIGLSGLKASQTQLSVTGQNISNINTPGYSRQTALQAARDPSFTGAGYIGNGTSIVDVQRIHNQFLTSQLRSSTSINSEVTAFQSQIEELNGLLSGNATGINPAMQSFFNALQTSIEDPASLPARQLFLSEAEGLASKFNTVHERLTVQNQFIGQQMGTVTDQVSRLVQNIASYNDSIAKATANGSQPNDLLDQRDEAIRQLSQFVGVTVVPQGDSSVNVFVGSGQPLVVGNEASQLTTAPGKADPNRVEIQLVSGQSTQDITGLISGGELGGLLRYRGELDSALNSVGRMALSISSEVNHQLAQGLDLNGALGAGLFTDINSDAQMELRSIARSGEANLSVRIEDTSKLTTSDYEVTIREGIPEVRRLSDNQVIRPVAGPPDSYDGFSFAGATPDGKYLVTPTRDGAGELEVAMKDPRQLAFAAPLSGLANDNNRGSARITQPEIVGDADWAALSSLSTEIVFRNGKFEPEDRVTAQPSYVPGSTTNLVIASGGMSFKITVSGTPLEGDTFSFRKNSGTSDNRNGLKLSEYQTKPVIGASYKKDSSGDYARDGNGALIAQRGVSLADGYGTLIQNVGTLTAQARSESEASGAVLKQATSNRDSVSAVNLDEEAANLIKFEQYYNASAQVIQIARSIFDTLINSVR